MHYTDKITSQGVSGLLVTAGLAFLLAFSGSGWAEAQIQPQIKPGQFKPQKKLNVLSNAHVNLRPYGFEITTVQASKIQGRVSSSGVNWECKGKVCSTNVKYPGFGVTACNKMALVIGTVRAFRLTRQPPAQVPVKGYPFNAKQIARCNQGVSGQNIATVNPQLATPVTRYSAPRRTGTITGSSPVDLAANRVKKIGEAGNRMKQAKELQRLRDLGSVVDQVKGTGATGQQDCTRSANRADCVRGSINAGPKAAEPPGGRNRAQCLQAGGDPWSCMSGAGNSGSKNSGTITSGPRLQSADEVQRRSGAEQRSNGVPWGPWHRNSSGTETRSRTTHEIHRGSAGGPTTTVVSQTRDWLGTKYSSQTTRDSDGKTIETRSLNLDRNGNFVHSEHDTYDYNDDGSYTQRHRENLVDDETSNDVDLTLRNQRGPVDNPTGQTAPDSASSGPADNCNWNPALGRCMTPTPDPKGMTTQPGPDGENTGGILGRNAPKTDVGAAINCGDTSTEACNRVGSGLNNGAKRLDMKDDNGPVPGASPN